MYSLENGQVAYAFHLSNSAQSIAAAKNCDKFTARRITADAQNNENIH